MVHEFGGQDHGEDVAWIRRVTRKMDGLGMKMDEV